MNFNINKIRSLVLSEFFASALVIFLSTCEGILSKQLRAVLDNEKGLKPLRVR
jgi:hypothetical protein